ncbi:hypothetical protein C8Q70DRAFT_167347 [Cubamyces menziesii]|nr:hypothetical protein C8Q70DRAFT_167347 [Cubamyces menziesii]
MPPSETARLAERSRHAQSQNEFTSHMPRRTLQHRPRNTSSFLLTPDSVIDLGPCHYSCRLRRQIHMHRVCPQCLVQQAHPSVHCLGASTNSRRPCAFWPRQRTRPYFMFDGNADRDSVNVTADSDPSCSMRGKWPLQECILCGATMNNRRSASLSHASSAAAWTIAVSSLTSRPRAKRRTAYGSSCDYWGISCRNRTTQR